MSGFVNGKVIKDASVNIKNKLNRQAHTTTASDGKDVVNVEFLKLREAGFSFEQAGNVVTVKNADGVVIGTFNVGGGGWTPVSATESVEGIVKTSTVQQLIDGTNDSVAVTPKDLKDAGYVRDSDYVHTDNNLTDEWATKLSELEILKEPTTGYIVKSAIVPFTRAELIANGYVLQHNLNAKRYLSQWISFSPLGFGALGNTKASYTPSDLEADSLATVHVIDGNSIKLENFVYPWSVNELNDVVYYTVQYVENFNPPLITSLGCNTAITLSPIIEGQSVSGNTLTVNYTGGNGNAYDGQVININGMTLTLASGTLNNGSGAVVFTMTGTPNVIGYVNIPMNFAGQACTVTLTVQANASVTFNCNDISIDRNDGVTYLQQGVPLSAGSVYVYLPLNVTGVKNVTVSGGSVNGVTVANTVLQNISGNYVGNEYIVSGTPISTGTFFMPITIDGVACSFPFTVGNPSALVSSIDCGGAVLNNTLTEGQVVPTGTTLTVGYMGGNGGSYTQLVQTVNGLTFTLSSGSVANGAGSLVYSVTGTPTVNGGITVPINFGGQSCSVTNISVTRALSLSSVQYQGNNTIQYNWTPNFTTVKLDYSIDGGTTWVSGSDISGVSPSTLQINGLSNGTPIKYRVTGISPIATESNIIDGVWQGDSVIYELISKSEFISDGSISCGSSNMVFDIVANGAVDLRVDLFGEYPGASYSLTADQPVFVFNGLPTNSTNHAQNPATSDGNSSVTELVNLTGRTRFTITIQTSEEALSPNTGNLERMLCNDVGSDLRRMDAKATIFVNNSVKDEVRLSEIKYFSR